MTQSGSLQFGAERRSYIAMEPRELVKNWVAAFNRADADEMATFYAEDAVNHQVV